MIKQQQSISLIFFTKNWEIYVFLVKIQPFCYFFENFAKTEKKSYSLVPHKSKQVSNIIVLPWSVQHILVKKLINFEIFISTIIISFKIQYFLSHVLAFGGKNNFEIFNIFETDIISVEMAKVWGYICTSYIATTMIEFDVCKLYNIKQLCWIIGS